MDSENSSLERIRNELNKIISHSSEEDTEYSEDSTKESPSVHFNNDMEPNDIDKVMNSEIGKKAAFLNTTALQSIDDDVLKIRSELNKSYQLFQNAGEAFESINFNHLDHRIRDLHLTASQPEIDAVMEEKTVKDRLNKLTDVMGDKFRQHPGEFGNIPELSSFFKACNQLQQGLRELKRHRSDMNELGQRMNWATNLSNERTDEIQKALNIE